MNKVERQKKFNDLFFELSRLKITKNAKNKELDDLIDEIRLLDGYYAGVAQTASQGGFVSSESLYDIDQLFTSFKRISEQENEDKKLLEECSHFLEIFKQINSLLKNQK